MRRIVINLFLAVCLSGAAHAQKKVWEGYLTATQSYMQHHLWNSSTGNYVLRADHPDASGTDSWGLTIVLDADAYMVTEGLMTPAAMKQYFVSSTMIYS